jgi:hypothetical protein
VIVFHQAIILVAGLSLSLSVDVAALIHTEVSITSLAELSWTRGPSVPSDVPAWVPAPRCQEPRQLPVE